MTKEEIIKSLRVCSTQDNCLGCGRQLESGCFDRLMHDAADLIEALGQLLDDALQFSVKPIPVTERLPEQDIPVLAWFEDGLIPRQSPDIVLWNGYGWMHRHLHRNVCGITHWAPLPERPKTEVE